MKKVLSFVLVLAMILGCTSMAFATTFVDQATITNKEAVAVLNAVGVLEGDENGNMRPTATLTRAEACAMIARLMLGTKAAKKLTATVAPFKDVAADNWAAGYVAYCASEGIVAGVGNDNFNPAGTLKVGEFGKMLLCVLGYDAVAEGLTGSDWANNTSKLMVKAGINVEEANNEDCAREVAAQLALNALKADCVEYDNSGASISVGGTTIEFGKGAAKTVNAKKVNGVEKTYLADGTTDGAMQLAEKLYSDKLAFQATGYDDLGRPGKTWKYDNDPVGTFGQAAEVVYTASTKDTQVDKDLKAYITDGGVRVVSNTAVAQTSQTGVVLDADAIADLTGNGKTVEVYVNAATKEIDTVVVIVPEFGSVESAVVTKATSAHGEYTTYKFSNASKGNAITKKVYATFVGDEDEDGAVLNGTFAKGDKVTYYQGANMCYVDPVSQFSGILTTVSNKKVHTIDGTSYKLSEITGAGEAAPKKTAQTFYLDKFGYLIKGDTTTETKYAYVVAVESKLVAEDNIVKPTTFASLVLTDGTVVEVKASAGAVERKIVTYTVNTKDVYDLTEVRTTNVAFVNALGAKTSLISESATKKLYANTKTVYYVMGYDIDEDGEAEFNGTVKVYTGYANAPAYDVASVAALDSSKTKDEIADVVFIDTEKDAVQSGSYVYVKGAYNKYSDTKFEYAVVVAGENSTVVRTSADLKADTLYKKVAGNTVTTATAVSYGAFTTRSSIVQNKGGFIYLNDVHTDNTIADDTPVYFIDIDDDSVVVGTGLDLETKFDTKASTTAAVGAEVRGIYLEYASGSTTKVAAVYILFDSEDN